MGKFLSKNEMVSIRKPQINTWKLRKLKCYDTKIQKYTKEERKKKTCINTKETTGKGK